MIPARTADDEPFAATEPTDPDEGLTEAQREVVARFNIERAAQAAIDLAAMRLKTIRPWAESVTKELGITVDWSSEAGRAGLLECLKAHRNASAELLRRDAGDVIDTPPAQDGVQWPPQVAEGHEKPAAGVGEGKRIADALANWEKESPRSDKTRGVFRRHAAMFGQMMGDPSMHPVALVRRCVGLQSLEYRHLVRDLVDHLLFEGEFVAQRLHDRQQFRLVDGGEFVVADHGLDHARGRSKGP